MPNKKHVEKPSSYKLFILRGLISPTIAAITDRLLFHPIDNIVTIQQAKNLRFSIATNYLYKQDNLKGFFKGIKYTLYSSILSRLTSFGFYYNFKSYLENKRIMSEFNNTVCASLSAGLLDTIVMCPAENFRTRNLLNLQGHQKISGLYKGFTPMLLKGTAGAVFILAGSDYIIKAINNYTYSEKNVYSPFLSGFIAGAIAQIATTPFDVLKTKVMEQDAKTTLLHESKKILRDGLLFRGLFARVNRVGLSCAISVGIIKNLNEKFESQLIDHSISENKI